MTQLHKLIERLKIVSVRYRYLLLFATVFGGSLIIISINNHTELLLFNSAPSWDLRRYEIVGDEESFTIKTQGCSIPGLQPYDEAINKFIKKPNHLKACPNADFPLLENNETHIWINTNVLHMFDVPKDLNVTCCYKSFYRPSAIYDISASDVDDRAEYNTCIEFSDYIEVNHEFVQITCAYDEYKTIYEQYYLFAQKKSKVYNRDEYIATQNESSYNVIVMGIDAISRLNFHRTMPKTLAFLKKKGAVELLGYNKVGDNTFPNLTPMLLGMKDTDLKHTCWPNDQSTFDNCPFIWEWYKDSGYYTALGEDSASLGTFNFEKFGFSRTPTDYYLHTFMHEAERHIGNNKDFNSYLCMGHKYFYQVLLDYIEQLSRVLRTSKLFGFFWEVTMSHDYLNYPMYIDNSYEAFLSKLDSTGYLNNTVLIMLSDHGMRWGEIRSTKQGRLEERLPFVHILLPPSFQIQYNVAYSNLILNSKRLSSPYDIHATLSDLTNLDNIKNESINARCRTSYSINRSISLFLPIPVNRTCESAGIDDHWCTCHRTIRLSRSDTAWPEAATHLVDHLNKILQKYHQCAKLSLKETLDVTELISGTPYEDEVGWREFMAVVRTAPGDGVFEATLRLDNNGWSLAGTVSRLNLYGEQSRCMHHYQLKLYCYCK